MKYSVVLRNAQLNQVEVVIGTTMHLHLFSGAEPVNVAAADPSGLLALIVCDSDWCSDAAAGIKNLLGTISGTGIAAGNVASFRMKTSASTTTANSGVTHVQGTVTAAGGGGDLTVDNVNIAIGQTINVTTGTGTGFAAGNA